VLPSRSATVLLILSALSLSACTGLESRQVRASGDRDGLGLDFRLSATTDSLVVDATVRNTRAYAVYLDADQCGRVTEVVLARTAFEPDGETYTGSLQAVKQLVLQQQRSAELPDRFAPRRVTGGSTTPDCVRPTRPIELAAGGTIEEHWALSFETAFGLAAVGSDHAVVRAEAVESVAADKLGFLDILPTGAAEADRAGRAVEVASPASAVLDRKATRPDTGPSLGQRFDRMVENETLRGFIEAQPADSWRDARMTPTVSGSSVFHAVTTGFEQALVATLAPDGAVSGEVGLPGAADRLRVFERRPATLPPGIGLIPEPDTPALTEDVVAGRLSLPTGRLVADGALVGDARPLADRAEPGDYPVSVTVGRLPGSQFDQVAYASVVVSDAPTVSWAQRSTIAVDGGTAGFISAEGSEALGTQGAAVTDVLDRAFDSLTAHDDVITEFPIGDGLDLALFSSGYGDGGYDVYVGLDGDGKPTRFVIDFAIVHLGWP
jgi:hypothetical protein